MARLVEMVLIQRLDFLRSLSFHSAYGLGTNFVSLSASTKVDLPIAKCSRKKDHRFLAVVFFSVCGGPSRTRT